MTRLLRGGGRVATVLALAAALALAWRHPSVFDTAVLAGWMASHPAAPLLFLAAHTIASLIFIPRTVLAVAAGILFGPVWGTVLAAAGSVLGAVAGFLVARHLNAGMIEPEAMPRVGPVLRRAETGGWRAVAALRLIPVLPHSLVNYALGLTRLSLPSYAVGSLLGQLPLTIAYVDFGTAGGRLWVGSAGWLTPTLVGAAALLLSLLLPRFAARGRP